MKRHYCTYFDSNYLSLGLSLYQSLQENCSEPFILWVLCFDEKTFSVLENLKFPNLELISLREFEELDEALLQAKRSRSRLEYYWTCTPSLPLYILKRNPSIEIITYLDADLFFLADPGPIFEELGDGSILILEHRFPPELKELEEFGFYNVSLMCFRRDAVGLFALEWWRERCNEWCYAYSEDGKYGDQKYLDDWPSRFDHVVVLQHKGAGLAPWNFHGYDLTRLNSDFFVDEVPLIFYHFHRFRLVRNRIFAHGTDKYSKIYWGNFMNDSGFRKLYLFYSKQVSDNVEMISVYSDGRQHPPDRIATGQLLAGLLKGEYFYVYDNIFTRWLARFGLWRADGEWKLQRGEALFVQGDLRRARREVLAALIRDPRILMTSLFWRVMTP